MIEVNREMTWEEACRLYHGRKSFFKILTEVEHQGLMYPKDIFVERVSETGEEVIDMREEFVKRGIYSIEFSDFPKEAYPLMPPGVGMPIYVCN